MATTNFETGTTITKEWLNDVDAAVYETLPDTIADVATNTANIATKAASGANTDIDSLQGPIEIKTSGGTTQFTLSGTNSITTTADIIGEDENFGISSKGSVYIFIDSDNSSTSTVFSVSSDSPGTTGDTILFTVAENGAITVPSTSNLVLDGPTNTSKVGITSYTSTTVDGNICTGYEIPTLTIVSGLTSVDPIASWYWMRVGNMVLVNGAVNVDPSAATGPTAIEFAANLPIDSSLGAGRQLGGVAANSLGDVIRITADTTNDRVTFTGTVNTTTNSIYNFNYSYVVV